MESRTQAKLNLLNFLLDSVEELDNEQEETKDFPNQNVINQILAPQYLEMKRSEIINRVNNSPKAELDFRRACAIFQKTYPAPDKKSKQDFKKRKALNKKKNPTPNPELQRSYHEYVKAYNKATSLYRLIYGNNYKIAILKSYDTEEESYKSVALKFPKAFRGKACLTALSNGDKLFWYGYCFHHAALFIIDSNYKFREIKSDKYLYASPIYFKRNIYCYGGDGYVLSASNHFTRYDLDKNKWVTLQKMPIAGCLCNSVICNGNILITEYSSKDLFLYSIDIDSFSTIFSDFARNAKKILINAGKLYLIEFNGGFVYESQAGDGYKWDKIGKSIISNYNQAYGLYNKGGIYIITESDDCVYYKFDLNKNEMFKL